MFGRLRAEVRSLVAEAEGRSRQASAEAVRALDARFAALLGSLVARLERVEADVKELRERKGASPEVIERIVAAETEVSGLRRQVRSLQGSVANPPGRARREEQDSVDVSLVDMPGSL